MRKFKRQINFEISIAICIDITYKGERGATIITILLTVRKAGLFLYKNIFFCF